MSRRTTTLDYATPAPPSAHSHITATSVGRFFAGIAADIVVAVLIVYLDSMLARRVFRAPGVGSYHEAVQWAVGIAFVAFVIYAQKRRRWTGFTWGVVAGVGLALVAGGVFLVVWASGMSQLH